MQIKYEKEEKEKHDSRKSGTYLKKVLFLRCGYVIITPHQHRPAFNDREGREGAYEMILPVVKQINRGVGACVVPREITCSYIEEYGKLGAEALASFVAVSFRDGEAFLSFAIDDTLADRAEIYRLTVTERGIRVGYRDARDAVNGAMSAVLLLRKQKLDVCEIIDYPDCAYRSFMLDMARGLPKEGDMKNAIRYMALAKYNRLHLHLIDDKGPCYVSNVLPEYAFVGTGGQCDVSFLRELDALCASYAIEIVPEIEIPAHGTALCMAHPEFKCEVVDAHDWAICPGNDDIWPFFESLIGEIADIFPRSEYIHIGTDELEFADLKPPRLCHWDDCPRCTALREREGLADRQAEFYYVVEKMHDIVKACGKKMMMWNDQIDVSRPVPLDRDILIQFWRIAAPGRGPHEGCSLEGFLKLGFSVVNAYYPYTYCDVENYISAEKMKSWTPYSVPAQLPEYAAQILGGESCAWEYGNFEEYPFYGYTTPAVIGMFGDKLWTVGEREHDDDYRRALSAYIFGSEDMVGIFDVIGGLIPPRSSQKVTYADPSKLCEKRIRDLIARLDHNTLCAVSSDYIGLLNKILELIQEKAGE
jgi:hypothetical protein